MKRIVLIVVSILLTAACVDAQKPWDNGKLQVSENQRFLQFENGKPKQRG